MLRSRTTLVGLVAALANLSQIADLSPTIMVVARLVSAVALAVLGVVAADHPAEVKNGCCKAPSIPPAAVGCLALVLLMLAGCTPAQQMALETAASIGKEVACSFCQKPLPAPPAVSGSPSPDQLLGLAAWAASVEVRMHEVEKAVAEELAKQAQETK